MLHRVRFSILLMSLGLLVLIALPALGSPGFTKAKPDTTPIPLEITNVDWTTNVDMVRFHLMFHNPNPAMQSEPTMVDVMSQPYGAFAQNFGTIGHADIPPLAPDSFFDVFFDVPLSSLPPKPEEIFNSSRAPTLNTVGCDPGDHWDGNIDVIWSGATGGGHANYHIGDQLACPGGGNSYIHVKGFFCAGPVGWAIGAVCPGWSAALVNEDFTPAPNPVPPGWTGWLCMKADASVPVGQVCCVDWVFTCGGQSVTVRLCTTACIWSTPTEPMTWGKIKSLFR